MNDTETFENDIDNSFNNNDNDNSNFSTFTNRHESQQAGAEIIEQRLNSDPLIRKIELLLMSCREEEVSIKDEKTGMVIDKVMKPKRIVLKRDNVGRVLKFVPAKVNEEGKYAIIQYLTTIVNKHTELAYTTTADKKGLNYNMFMIYLIEDFVVWFESNEYKWECTDPQLIQNTIIGLLELHLSKTVNALTSNQISGTINVTESVKPPEQHRGPELLKNAKAFFNM